MIRLAWWQRLDWLLLVLISAVPVAGLVILYSAGYAHNEAAEAQGLLAQLRVSPPFLKQLGFFCIGVLVAFVAAVIPPRWYSRLAPFVYGAGIVLLILVAFMGTIKNGSRRWLSFGRLNLQPAEFMKLGVILMMARFMSKKTPPPGGYLLFDLWQPALIFLLPMAFILKQPDLGTALSVGAVGGMMLCFAGIRLRTILFLFLAGVIAAVPLWMSLHKYQRNRVLALLHAEEDPQGTGYHIIQSKIAVGSGELTGKGFLQGTQNQLEFLPEHTTDFIFSVLAEEWGFLGCSLVLLVYYAMLWAMLGVASRTKDLFAAYVVVGITAQIFFHAFVNIGMVVGILPVVGIPLPLFSYGGSSVLSSMLSIGIVVCMSIKRPIHS